MTTERKIKPADYLKLVRFAAENDAVSASKRDAAIRLAHEEGNSVTTISGESGLPPETVQRIIERRSD